MKAEQRTYSRKERTIIACEDMGETIKSIRLKSLNVNGNKIDFSQIKEGIRDMKKDDATKNQLTMRALEAKRLWERYSMTYGNDYGILSYEWDVNRIYGVTPLEWRKGCTPIAAAMVLDYWDQHGYPNFPNDYQTTLIDELADAMGTWDNGYTPLGNVVPGINEVCNNHGYGNWAGEVLQYTQDFVRSEIDSSKPHILTMFMNSKYGSHSVTVIGYMFNRQTTEDFIEVWDTWATDSTQYISWGDWWLTEGYRVHPQ